LITGAIVTPSFTFQRSPAFGSETPVILLPGLFGGGWIWDGTMAALRDAGVNAVTAVESIALADCMNEPLVEAVTAAMLASADAAGLSMPAVWCGNSFGALVALDIAVRFPERAVGIVMSGSPGLTPEPNFGLPHRIDSALAHTAVARMFHDPSKLPRERVEETFKQLVRPRPMRCVIRGLQASRTYEVSPALEALNTPALFVWGRQDTICPWDPWVDAAAALPDGTMTLVDCTGHSPMIEAPADFAAPVIAFMARVDGTTLATVRAE
jgi:pimeloyl-ACP methyl ester carboxylesterase